MEFTFYVDRLWYAIPLSVALVWLHHRFIVWMNRRWERRHGVGSHHSYSPLFTAIGVLMSLAVSCILFPWQIAAWCYSVIIAMGGLSWAFHDRRHKQKEARLRERGVADDA